MVLYVVMAIIVVIVVVGTHDDTNQVIQAVTFLSPNVGGHLPLKGSMNHPKKVKKKCQVHLIFIYSPVN